jgi:hypothetical protein
MATKKQPHSAMTQMAASLTKPASVAAVKVRKSGARPELQRINSPKTNQGRNELFKEGGDTMATKMNPGFMAMMAKKKDGAKGGMPAALAKHASKPASKAHAGLKGGGYVKAADGIASKGKTKGTQVTMKKGGTC